MLIGRQVVRSFPVEGSAYKGQVVVKSHVGKMGNSAPTLRARPAPISATVNGSDPTFVVHESRCYAAKTDDIANEEIRAEPGFRTTSPRTRWIPSCKARHRRRGPHRG